LKESDLKVVCVKKNKNKNKNKIKSDLTKLKWPPRIQSLEVYQGGSGPPYTLPATGFSRATWVLPGRILSSDWWGPRVVPSSFLFFGTVVDRSALNTPNPSTPVTSAALHESSSATWSETRRSPKLSHRVREKATT
jgi:hypothetical protein